MKYVIEVDAPKSCEIAFNVKKVLSIDIYAKDTSLVITENGNEIVSKKLKSANIRVFAASLDNVQYQFSFDYFGNVMYFVIRFEGDKHGLTIDNGNLDATFTAR